MLIDKTIFMVFKNKFFIIIAFRLAKAKNSTNKDVLKLILEQYLININDDFIKMASNTIILHHIS